VKVRADVYLGEENRIDLSFLEKREAWLPGTGIYLEFILKGVYDKNINFKIEGNKEEVMISRYSWNRYFLNLRESGDVTFRVLCDGEEIASKVMHFNIMNINVPLSVSVPNLMAHPVSDIRYFANRLSENMVNMTRFILFSPGFLEKLDENMKPSREFFKFYEMIFSILTERGLSLVITPYADMVYSLDFVKEQGKDILWEFVERGKKFNIVWDFTSGLRHKELGGLLDSVWNKFKEEVDYAVMPHMVEKIGGEGFACVIETFGPKDIPSYNDKGVKIARLLRPTTNYYALRSFTTRFVENNWGVELAVNVPFKQLRSFKYALGKAIHEGYRNAKNNS